jgi:hypothetical protein
MTTTNPLEPQYRRKIKLVSVAAFALLLADLIVTVALDGLAYEAHPLGAWLAATLGWRATALVSTLVFGALYAWLMHRGDRLALVGSMAPLPILAGAVVWNAYIYMAVGLPTLLWEAAFVTVAPAGAVALMAVVGLAVTPRTGLDSEVVRNRPFGAVVLCVSQRLFVDFQLSAPLGWYYDPFTAPHVLDGEPDLLCPLEHNREWLLG